MMKQNATTIPDKINSIKGNRDGSLNAANARLRHMFCVILTTSSPQFLETMNKVSNEYRDIINQVPN